MKKPIVALHIMHGLIIGSLVLMAALPTQGTVIEYSDEIPPVSTAQAQLREVTDGLICTGEKEPRLTNRVFVLNTITDKVYEVTFDKAVNVAGDGVHQVLAYCN